MTLKIASQSLNSKLVAKGDPVPTFLQFFYNNEVGKEAPEPEEDPAAVFFSISTHKSEEAGADIKTV